MKRILYKAFFVTLVAVLFTSHSNGQSGPKVKNVILLIADGMGVAQLSAAMISNHGQLNIERATHGGFMKTSSANDLITDSGAAGTAMATGHKTTNKTIGLDQNGKKVESILELAEEKGLSTGLVSTSSITHATPAAFVAHVTSRYEMDSIAMAFAESNIDIFIGGGKKFFENRKDAANISDSLIKDGYEVVYHVDSVKPSSVSPIACLAAEEHMPKAAEGRGDFFPKAVDKSLKKLSQNDKGFFLMAEGSQVDWGGHDNDTKYIISETIDFDKAVSVAFDFADKVPGTLVIVTADHETGGMAITGGNKEEGEVIAKYASGGHTPVMVPVFAYGEGADRFGGIYENTELFNKIKEALIK